MPYRVISADSHVVEPPHLWEEYLPSEFQRFAPRIVPDDDGGDAWQLGDGVVAPIGLVTVKPGRSYRDPDYRWTGMKMSDANQGAFYPEPRLAEQDEDGVDAEILFGPNRTMMYFTGLGDRDLALAAVQAYNNWMAKEYCAAAPDRLFGLCMIPNTGIEDATEELRRGHAMGMKGCVLWAWPSGNGGLSDADDPFWSEAERLKMPVNIHVRMPGAKGGLLGASRAGSIQGQQIARNPLVSMSTSPVEEMPTLLCETVFSGLFDRYPTLQFVGAEVNIGWVPEILQMMDDAYARDRYWTGTDLQKDKPSEYWFSNWACTFLIDRFGVASRQWIGVENALWSTDYPHHRTDWPNSMPLVDEMMRDVPDSERHLMLAGNAVRIYGLDEG